MIRASRVIKVRCQMPRSISQLRWYRTSTYRESRDRLLEQLRTTHQSLLCCIESHAAGSNSGLLHFEPHVSLGLDFPWLHTAIAWLGLLLVLDVKTCGAI
jgi:hypothetical protein